MYLSGEKQILSRKILSLYVSKFCYILLQLVPSKYHITLIFQQYPVSHWIIQTVLAMPHFLDTVHEAFIPLYSINISESFKRFHKFLQCFTKPLYHNLLETWPLICLGSLKLSFTFIEHIILLWFRICYIPLRFQSPFNLLWHSVAFYKNIVDMNIKIFLNLSEP